MEAITLTLNSPNLRVHYYLLPWCALLVSLLLIPAAQAEWHYQRAEIMGTEISVYLWHDQPQQARAAAAAVIEEMHRIDRWLSPWIATSELSRVNATAAQSPVAVSSELMLLLQKSHYYAELSEGAFDISFASVGYRYDYRNKKQPNAEQTAQLLPAVNYRLIKLDPVAGTVFFAHPNLRIDLGGIAKGYAVEQAGAIVRAMGVKQATISAGGDSRILGDKRGRPWLVGIKNPRDENTLAMKIPLTETAMSTSGDYERYFIDEVSGERVHHILNPRTGRPSEGLISVTVLGPNGLDTDPLSTTVFVLGLEKGMALIERLPDFDVIAIDRLGKVHFSAGLAPAAQ